MSDQVLEIKFVKPCINQNCWHTIMPDGTRHFFFEVSCYQRIGRANKRKVIQTPIGARFANGAGPCPLCGNEYTNCETVLPEPLLSKNS